MSTQDDISGSMHLPDIIARVDKESEPAVELGDRSDASSAKAPSSQEEPDQQLQDGNVDSAEIMDTMPLIAEPQPVVSSAESIPQKSKKYKAVKSRYATPKQPQSQTIDPRKSKSSADFFSDPTRSLPEIEQVNTTHALPKQMSKYEYRRYQAILPCCNRKLAMKWDESNKDKHLQKIRTMQATVDNSPPRLYTHLLAKMKPKQMKKGTLSNADRDDEITRTNKILVEKMSYIMDLEAKDPRIHATPKYPLRDQVYERNRELLKIREANLELIQRLARKEAHYDQKQMHKDRLTHLTYLGNISRYPEKVLCLTQILQEKRALKKSIKPYTASEAKTKSQGSRISELRIAFSPWQKSSNQRSLRTPLKLPALPNVQESTLPWHRH